MDNFEGAENRTRASYEYEPVRYETATNKDFSSLSLQQKISAQLARNVKGLIINHYEKIVDQSKRSQILSQTCAVTYQ